MEVHTERVGDLALLSSLIDRTGLVGRIDAHFPAHHLWEGPSLGKILKGFLLYILSENDHRLYEVESWASSHIESLRWLLSEPDLQTQHFSDDHLGIMLDNFSKSPVKWSGFQRDHNEHLIRLYDLGADESKQIQHTARIDSTTVQSYRAIDEDFQIGHNAQGSDLPQLKAMLLAIDKANLAMAMEIVAGNQGDDNLYCSCLELAWHLGLPQKHVLIVGDGKLANQENTSYIAKSGNYYLSPLVQRQYTPKQLLAACKWIEQHSESPKEVIRLAAGAKEAQPIALAIELPGRSIVFEDYQHQQRLIAVCVLSKKNKRLTQLESQITQARQAVQERLIRKRGRRTLKQEQEALEAINKILATYNVDHLFKIHIQPPLEKDASCRVELQIDQQVYQDEKLIAGWRVFGSNAPKEELPPEQAVLCYWEEYRIEQQFHLLLNKCTALSPIFLSKQNRIKALMQIMMMALQYSNLWQYSLRQQLAKEQEPYLLNVIPGNPGRKVDNPTTALVLRTFKDITLIIVTMPHHVNVLIQGFEHHHLRLLRLLGQDENLYFTHPLCQRT